jgi:phosphoribosylformylglycinamidine synthase
MGQIVGCLDGMAQACVALNYPIISGNVSLYNETMGTGVHPTPAIGGVGLLDDVDNRKTIAFKHEDEDIIIIGETKGEFGSSIYCRDVCGCAKSAPPRVDLQEEFKNAAFILSMNEYITACHDVSDGGMVIALSEMAMNGNLGAEINIESKLPLHTKLFAEDQARYILTTRLPQTILNKAKEAGVYAQKLGKVKGNKLVINDKISVSVDELKTAHEKFLPEFMS